ncbi:MULTISPECIES: pentapeptide repeat-containing protein [unclassified Nonomuraea]|uniref:pentapeptide repeat-containing protein n=1 Tax=unclassified Nonomuraea TaxID=2593643 RepID=UPI0033CE12FA
MDQNIVRADRHKNSALLSWMPETRNRQRLTTSNASSTRTAEKTMSSGTRNHWTPARPPEDGIAAQRVREWIDAGEGGLDAVGLNLSGADLSHGDFSESWFTGAKLVNLRLRGAELYRSDAHGADFSGADLTECSLVRVNLDDAVMRGAILDGANLVKASLYGVDASGASCRGTQFMGSSLLGVNLRSADLSNAVFQENSFKVTLDQNTKLVGASGSVFGPVVIVENGISRELSGSALEEWLTLKGGSLRVMTNDR